MKSLGPTTCLVRSNRGRTQHHDGGAWVPHLAENATLHLQNCPSGHPVSLSDVMIKVMFLKHFIFIRSMELLNFNLCKTCGLVNFLKVEPAGR